MVETQFVTDLMRAKKYDVDFVSEYARGFGLREVFEVTSDNKSPVIVRFEGAKKEDPQYGGHVTLQREAGLFELARHNDLPVPEVLDVGEWQGIPYLVVSKMPGIRWKRFLQASNYSGKNFVASMGYLGEGIAKAHSITFPSYGDALGKNQVEPAGLTTLAERLPSVFERKLALIAPKEKGLQRLGKPMTIFTDDELGQVREYFNTAIRDVSAACRTNGEEPVLVVTNLHPNNFLVDPLEGRVTAFHDMMFSQAGPKAMEMYNLDFQLWSYFDPASRERAREAFFNQYAAFGGSYTLEDSTNRKLEALFCAGHILSSVIAYAGADREPERDPLRAAWSAEFKKQLFQIIDTGKVDYVAFADVIRQKTRQPKQPL